MDGEKTTPDPIAEVTSSVVTLVSTASPAEEEKFTKLNNKRFQVIYFLMNFNY